MSNLASPAGLNPGSHSVDDKVGVAKASHGQPSSGCACSLLSVTRTR
jgi:hypothetical protein